MSTKMSFPVLFLAITSTIVVVVVGRQIHVERMLGNLHMYQETYLVPRLPYRYDEYEPWLDGESVRKHHEEVHKERTQNMNKLLKEWRASNSTPGLAKSSIFGILRNINKVPDKWREGLRNSIGGYLNHIFYFAVLTPNPTGETKNLSRVMTKVFYRSFVNLTTFQKRFNETASGVFESGYVWMCRDPAKRYMNIFSSAGEASPITEGMQPLLGIDLWEHAYWSKYQNNREEYLRNWWKLVDFDKVENVLDWWWSFDPYDSKYDPNVNVEYRYYLEDAGYI